MQRDALEAEVEAYGVAMSTGNRLLIAMSMQRLKASFTRLPDEIVEIPSNPPSDVLQPPAGAEPAVGPLGDDAEQPGVDRADGDGNVP